MPAKCFVGACPGFARAPAKNNGKSNDLEVRIQRTGRVRLLLAEVQLGLMILYLPISTLEFQTFPGDMNAHMLSYLHNVKVPRSQKYLQKVAEWASLPPDMLSACLPHIVELYQHRYTYVRIYIYIRMYIYIYIHTQLYTYDRFFVCIDQAMLPPPGRWT